MKSTIYQEIDHMIDQQFFPIVKIMRFIDNKAYVGMSANLADPFAKVSENFSENQGLRFSP